jgi:microcystin-dependent protein
VAIDFPNSPTTGQVFTSGNLSWTYDGSKWNLSGTSTSAFAPIGTIIAYAGSILPNGWIHCDGASYNRTTYEDLFGVIGTAFGEGSTPGTTFNVPNFGSSTAEYIIRAYDEAVILTTSDSLIAVPVGSLQLFAMNTVPTGWVRADGRELGRTAYADLFTAIGTTYGSGDGSTTFNIPNITSSGSGSPVYYIKAILSGDVEPSTVAHAGTHIRGGSDIIDADRAQIDFVPTYYIRDASPSQAGITTDLTAHLKGIDNSLYAPIIFSARGLASYTINSNVEYVFNIINVNAGNCYSSTTGRFTAPRNGYYAFHWSFLSENNSNTADTRIKINNSTIIGGAFSGAGVAAYKAGGGSASAFLNAGDYVSISSFNISYLHADPVHQLFSGYMIK